MGKWSPDEWNQFFIFAGGFLTVIAVQVTNMIISIRNGKKADTNALKLDANTTMTADIHKVTNGPLSAMEQSVRTIVTQAASNAAVARETAEAAKTQATIDAAASKGSTK